MPIYQYRCIECGEELEDIRSVNDADLLFAHCGKSMERMPTTYSIAFTTGGKIVSFASNKPLRGSKRIPTVNTFGGRRPPPTLRPKVAPSSGGKNEQR